MKLEDFKKIQEAFPTELSDNDKVTLEGVGYFSGVNKAWYTTETVIGIVFRRFVSKFPNYYL